MSRTPNHAASADSLAQRIFARTSHLGRGLLQAGSFLNHRVDTGLMTAIGREFARCFELAGIADISLVVTAETSGIAPALTTAQALGVPMVFARRQRPSTMVGKYYSATAPSHTKGHSVELSIAAEFIAASDRVVVIDDFLGTGQTIQGLLQLLGKSGCHICGLGFVLEKVYEGGRTVLTAQGLPVVSLARLDLDKGQNLVLLENRL